MPVLYTIGYGGRKPSELVEALNEHDIHWVVDVRLSPGAYLNAFHAETGMPSLLEPAIGYRWMPELGNPFYRDKTYIPSKYRTFLLDPIDGGYGALKILAGKLEFVSWTRVCLLCCERRAEECHRRIVAREAVKLLNKGTHTQGWEVIHIN